ncbi:putative ankyrin repeat protein [Megavirus lba]|uniref:Putative ankyrin repeat protein n=1 Tax=Megavirus lba TaxID=1235314 RepID=L7Y453_9VIRU|nr:putative ankyrin repeat protein [Megavirus lba]
MKSNHIFYKLKNIKCESVFKNAYEHKLHYDDLGYIYISIEYLLDYLYYDLLCGLYYDLQEVFVPIYNPKLLIKKNNEVIWKHDIIKLGNVLKLDDKNTWIYLLEQGAFLNKVIKITSVIGNIDIVKDLIKRGANANDGIIGAIESGKVEALKLLIENGANLEPLMNYDSSKKKLEDFSHNEDYLVIACKKCYVDIVKYLLTQNIDLTYSNQCIKYSIKYSHYDLVKCLIENCPGILHNIDKYINLADKVYHDNNSSCIKDPDNVRVIKYLAKIKKHPNFEIDIILSKIKHECVKLQQYYTDLDKKLQIKRQISINNDFEHDNKLLQIIKKHNTNNRKKILNKLIREEISLKQKLNQFV